MKKQRWLFCVLVILLEISVAVTIWVLFFRTSVTLTPDYAPRKKEVHAENIGDEKEEKLKQEEGGGAVSLTYTTQIEISLSDQMASLYFANPSKSNQDMVLQIVVQDVILAQSGSISPGKKVESLDLLEGAADQLEAGGYYGKFVVLYYQKDTHEKMIVNTEIPINVIVYQQ